jgi:hypothetical protein
MIRDVHAWGVGRLSLALIMQARIPVCPVTPVGALMSLPVFVATATIEARCVNAGGFSVGGDRRPIYMDLSIST